MFNKIDNILLLNGIDIGISQIELDKSDLIIIDKSGKYCLQVYVGYNWKDINSVEVGKRKEISFNEYCLAENNETALIWPSTCYVEKISDNILCFNLEFENLSSTTDYMNKRGHFDIELNSLEIKVFIDYKDVKSDSITYDF